MKLMFTRHIEELETNPAHVDELKDAIKSLRHLE